MNLIVPLAGPDFVGADGSVKALHDVRGRPLLQAALDGRSWRDEIQSTVFVLHDDAASRKFAEGPLREWYPGGKQVFLSHYSEGAAFTCMAALSLADVSAGPVCIDLCDILFDFNGDPVSTIDHPEVGGVAITFPSDNPVYSYLARDTSGRIVEAAEKRVISNEASAGVYFFKNPAVLAKAFAHSLLNRQALAHRDLLFVCPMFNGVLDQGLRVEALEATNVVDIKTA